MSDAKVIDLDAFRRRKTLRAAAAEMLKLYATEPDPAVFAAGYADMRLREMQLVYDGAKWIRVHDEPTPEQRAEWARADGRIVFGGAEGRSFELTTPEDKQP